MRNPPSWLFELAQFEYKFTQNTPISEIRIKTNELAKLNNVAEPYYATDVGVAKIYEKCKDEYHQNVIIAWQLYENAYYDLHNKYQCQRDELTPYEIDTVRKAYKALKFIDLLDILTDGLDDRTLKYLKKITK